MRIAFGLALAGVLGAAAPCVAAAPSPDQARIARIGAEVDRAEGVRRIKALQHAYVHYVQMGMWNEAAQLFTRDAEMIVGDKTISGRAAIGAWLLKTLGEGRPGLAPDRLHVEIVLAPVVTLAPDGQSGKGRWHDMAIDAHYRQRADWSGGIEENDYRIEDGRWKIARLHLYPQFAGPYQGGWHNVSADPKLVPYHYTPDEAGVPSIRLPEGAAIPPARGVTLAGLERRVARLNDEAKIRSLQDAYGYYVDRRMWDDVTDLFAPDGTLQSPEAGNAAGHAAIRAKLEALAPAGLKTGELNDHLQLDPVITVDPGGMTATARGIELGMIGKNGGDAFWTVAIFENRYVKRDGVWMVQAMRIFPRGKTDYFKGWAKSALPFGQGAYPAQVFPAISFANPATGRAPKYPQGLKIVALPAPRASAPPASVTGDVATRLDTLERNLAVASAYDGAQNVSTAYGYYIDEFLWHQCAALFAEHGWKELSYVGTYVGRDRVLKSMVLRYGDKGRTGPFLAIHQKIQPVTTVAPDGQSAKIHLRLFQIGTSPKGPASFIGGTYENKIVLEHGIWKIAGMDLDYIWLSDYDKGWARIDPAAAGRYTPKPGALADYPPDRPLRGPDVAPFPNLAPMPFHYRNPVSGRVPPLLLDE
jgi:hypothetical protein